MIMEDLQMKLISSEQRRIHLNQELQQFMSQSNKRDRLREIQMRSQVESLKLQRQARLQRNQAIRKQMEEFNLSLTVVSAKTQALRNLKNEYEEYIERLYPHWKEQVLAHAAAEKAKSDRLAGMKRDVVNELAVPYLSGPSEDNTSCDRREQFYSQSNSQRPPSNGFTSSTQVDGPSSHKTPSPSSSSHLRAAHESVPSFTLPNRSSTPEFYRPDVARHGMSTSMQSINSEKSVTFDERTFKSSRRSPDILLDYSPNASKANRKESRPYRHSPSPSELIRMSMTSSNSSLVDTSTVKLVDQPAEQQVSVELHPMSSKPPKPPQGPTTPRLSPSAENMPVTESTRAVENRCQVVIPSPENFAVDIDSVDQSASNPLQDVSSIPAVSPKEEQTASVRGPSHNEKHSPEINQTRSSLNSTETEEQPPAADPTETLEFKHFISGTRDGESQDLSDEGSEDSMDAIEGQYRQLVLNKTNTMPVGHNLPSIIPDANPSPDEQSSGDEDSLDAPMGYTPSFASAVKPSYTGSLNTQSAATAKTDGAASATATISGTGDSKNSSGSRKAALRRTESDIDSDSDTPNVLSNTSNRKPAANSDVEDDFDFYG
ncbi:hypothetical protein EB796_004650 [Bugula neritina]|uniref:Uncharacterized protein n=1 Tax=Bugula neritina TaxID=10212 RepID=A0A7J7KFQ3_BUGNE|nr:hypothetical protein EB796_004650 [Bugula neritina]